MANELLGDPAEGGHKNSSPKSVRLMSTAYVIVSVCDSCFKFVTGRGRICQR
jgi:hypothetical protein